MPDTEQRIYWHRDLPPLQDRIEGEHWITAKSDVIPHSLTHDSEVWGQCFPTLERNLEKRLLQEIERQGGHCAHILDERIRRKTHHADETCWLEGEYCYVLYLAPADDAPANSSSKDE
jgi:hypothetical protein